MSTDTPIFHDTHTYSTKVLDNARAQVTLPLPAPSSKPVAQRPFDKEKLLAQYRKTLPEANRWSASTYWDVNSWIKGDVLASASPEELRFWFYALTEAARFNETKDTGCQSADTLAQIDYSEPLTADAIIQRLKSQEQALRATFPNAPYVSLATYVGPYTLVLQQLLPREQHLPLLRRLLSEHVVDLSQIHTLIELVPIPADDQEREAIAPQARALLADIDPVSNANIELIMKLVLSAQLEDLYESTFDQYLSRELYRYHYSPQARRLFYTLPEAKQLELLPTLKRGLQGEDGVIELAMHGMTHMDQWLAIATSKKGEGGWFDFALHIDSPRVTRFFIDQALSGSRRLQAEGWLRTKGANAIAGLIPLTASRGNIKELAVATLRHYVQNGERELVAQIAEKLPEDTGKANLQKLVMEWDPQVKPPLETPPEWLANLVKSNKNTVPALLKNVTLPPVFTADGDHQLTEEQVHALLALLEREGDSHSHSQSVLHARRDLDRRSLGELSWVVFDSWLKNGAPSKTKWPYLAVGHFGTAREGQKVAPHLKIWPKQNKWRMAQDALEIYRMIGTDGALMTLHGVTQKVKQKSVRSQAELLLRKIATSLDLTPEQLEDRIIPDCELDETGRYTFDYGDRQFTLAFDNELQPVLKDEARGKIIKSLPKPGKNDDEELAEEARETFKIMKKQLKEVVSVQQPRLEQAMITGRTWRGADFQSLILGHPLMCNFAQRLLWGVLDKSGEISQCFRVDEENQLLDSEDEPFALSDAAKVCIAHPLRLSAAQRETWGTIFGDYQIFPPFPQLNRPTYALTAEEHGKKSVTRFAKLEIPAMTIRGFIENSLLWQRGQPEDAGIVNTFATNFPAQKVSCTVVMESGFAMGGYDWNPTGGLERVVFYDKGRSVTYSVWSDKDAMPLEEVPEIVFSEVLYSLYTLTSRFQ